MKIGRVAVIGAGQMGAGIAQVAAQAGDQVLLSDIDLAIATKGRDGIAKGLGKLVEKGKIDGATRDTVLGRITPVGTIEGLAGADLYIEAAVERVDLKTDLFKRLDQVAPPHAILASNTSSISITLLGAATKRPEKVIGMHFMNPVPVMQLVEVVRGLATNDETLNTVVELSKKLGKTPVTVNDSPGFVSNRVLLPMINEAIYALHEGVGTAEAIDTVMKLGMNHPMGPLALADLIGLDICLDILNVLYRDLGDPKYRACPLLKRMVAAGYLGRKTKHGFYTY